MTLSIGAQIILALFKAFPIIKEWLNEVHNHEIEEMKKANRESIEAGIKTGDQRPIEDAMNSTKTGEVSGHAGAEIVDHLPGID